MSAVPPSQALASVLRSLQHHVPPEHTTPRIQSMRDVAQDYAVELLAQVPHCRERSLALTHLEESLMWAVKAIVLNVTEPT